MPTTLSNLTYVIDENLLKLGRSVADLRTDMACFGQPPLMDLLPQGILDPEWIPVVGDRGWIVITNDGRLRTRPGEAELAIRHQLKAIHLYGAGNLTAWAQAVRLTHVSTGGTVTLARPTGRGQLHVHVGARHKQLPVTVLQDGIRVAIFAGNQLLRALDVDPTKTYQPLGRTKSIKH